MNSKNKKEGMFLDVCFKSYLVDVSLNFWWVDTGESIHVVNLLQGFVKKWRLKQDEVDLFIGNGKE